MSFWGASAATNLTHVNLGRTSEPGIRMFEISGSAPCGPSRNDGERSHCALQRLGEVGFFPREPAFIVRCPAEMTVGGGARVDRPVEIAMRAAAARRQIPCRR